jgi:hypothetical protein
VTGPDFDRRWKHSEFEVSVADAPPDAILDAHLPPEAPLPGSIVADVDLDGWDHDRKHSSSNSANSDAANSASAVGSSSSILVEIEFVSVTDKVHYVESKLQA